MPTTAHKEKWRDWEAILTYRANMAILIMALKQGINAMTGHWPTSKSQEFLESEKSDKFDRELLSTLLPYINVFLISCNIVRLILIALSYYKPGIVKHYLLMQMVIWAARSTALVDLGDVGRFYHSTQTLLMFLLTIYPCWMGIFYWLACYAYCTVGLVLIFELDPPDISVLLIRYAF